MLSLSVERLVNWIRNFNHLLKATTFNSQFLRLFSVHRVLGTLSFSIFSIYFKFTLKFNPDAILPNDWLSIRLCFLMRRRRVWYASRIRSYPHSIWFYIHSWSFGHKTNVHDFGDCSPYSLKLSPPRLLSTRVTALYKNDPFLFSDSTYLNILLSSQSFILETYDIV